MPWFKVDDNFAFHRKTVAAGNTAIGLWARAGAWSAGQLTDGDIPTDIVKVLGGRPADARKLVEVGLWQEADGGYEFHQWNEEDRQPKRSEVEAKRRRHRRTDRRPDRPARGSDDRRVGRDRVRRDHPHSERDVGPADYAKAAAAGVAALLGSIITSLSDSPGHRPRLNGRRHRGAGDRDRTDVQHIERLHIRPRPVRAHCLTCQSATATPSCPGWSGSG